jgi:hypothetical protein
MSTDDGKSVIVYKLKKKMKLKKNDNNVKKSCVCVSLRTWLMRVLPRKTPSAGFSGEIRGLGSRNLGMRAGFGF